GGQDNPQGCDGEWAPRQRGRLMTRRSGIAWLAAFVAVCGCVLLVSSACGYSLAGRGSFLPDYIKTIGVPTFANRTTVFNIQTQMTEKVRAEFIGRGKYRIVPDETNVDALLTGSVNDVNIQPVSFTTNQLASRYVITMTADVQLKDTHGNKILWENPGLIFRQEFEAPSSGQLVLDPSSFFGQDAN